MKYLLSGTVVPATYETEISQISNAANRFLLNFCGQFNEKSSIKILSYIGINISPKVMQEIKRDNFYIPITYFERSKLRVRGAVYYHKIIKKHLDEYDGIIAYNVVYAWIFAPIIAKMKKKKSILLLADYSPEESYKGIMKKIYARLQLWSIRKYDYVVGLSENTKEYLTGKQKFICIEGGISDSFYEAFNEKKNIDPKCIKIMYAGILEKVTGIEMLIDAFRAGKFDNAELVISGKGSLEDLIVNVTNDNPSITYLGCCPYDEYMHNLAQADILVNPRNMNLPENANNFPSKIMEYIATGKCVVSTKFPGWERFKDYILFCDSDVESIQRCLQASLKNVLENSEEEFKRKRLFSEQFLWEKQVDKIIDYAGLE